MGNVRQMLLDILNRTNKLSFLDVAIWVAHGDSGAIICNREPRCKTDNPGLDLLCEGCPVAYRTINGVDQYYRKPVHSVGRQN